jgi:hypothetical protein
MLSVHKLLARSTGRESLLSNLDLSQSDQTKLVDARAQIRSTLRIALAAASELQSDDGSPIIPKFFTQGSWAYKTLNNPTQLPPQQVDMDDGCYLPIGFIKATGKPKQAAEGFFSIADHVLGKLCSEQGWEYVDDNVNCCRVVIDAKMHLDVPLYAIDEERFSTLKYTEANAIDAVTADRADDSAEIGWARVPKGEVLHATRSGNWQSSDPMAVRDWADAAVSVNGEQLRSVWRYLKTWRDLKWEKGGPSSILLMVIADKGFDLASQRDDLKLRDVADFLAQEILKDVAPPWDENENLNRLKLADRETASIFAKNLVAELNVCFGSTISDKAMVLNKLRASLSVHIPDKVDAIEETGPYAAALALAPTRTETVPWAPNTQSG